MLTFVGHYTNPKRVVAHPEYLEVLKEKLGLTTIDAAAREGFVFGCDIYMPSLSMLVGHRYSDYKKFCVHQSPDLVDGKAVLVSEDDWSSIQETLYLLSIPGMRASIVEGLSNFPEAFVK